MRQILVYQSMGQTLYSYLSSTYHIFDFTTDITNSLTVVTFRRLANMFMPSNSNANGLYQFTLPDSGDVGAEAW